MTEEFFAFAAALVIAAGLTPVVRRVARATGFMDPPAPRKVHRTPTPLLGGVAIYSAALLGILLFHEGLTRTHVGILIGGTLLVGLGLLDDAGKLHHQIKFRVGMPMAALLLVVTGTCASVFPWTWLNVLVTIVWVVGIVCAFNLLDNMDGLSAGTAAVAAFFFAVMAAASGQRFVSLLAAVVVGAALGFLVYNFHPARIFMGDGGAMFLGFMAAVLGLTIRAGDAATHAQWMVPVALLGVPIFDTTLVTISRLRRGLVPFMSPGRDHFSHRLVKLGLHQRAVALVHYGLGVALGAAVLIILNVEPWAAYLIGTALVVVALVAIALLERVDFERQEMLGSDGRDL